MYNRAAFLAKIKKGNERKARKRAQNISKVTALPTIPRVVLNANYVNPITLNFPRSSMVVYEVKNRVTGRKDYYDVQTFWKLMGMIRNNYKLLMMDPKKPIARNPVTRNPVYPRNVRRVTVAAKKKTPSPKTAAKTIRKAVRKHLSKKTRSK
jgi:hypothetical protein